MGLVCPASADEKPADRTIRVTVWDEQQPDQAKAYDNFLGNAIANYLRARPGFSVRSVKLDDPEQGVSDEMLDHTDVLIWWGHIRNRQVKPEVGTRIVQRIVEGKLSLIALHSAHWSWPFVAAMTERAKEDAMKSLSPEDREKVKLEFHGPVLKPMGKGQPLTPRTKLEVADDGGKTLIVHLPDCIFPAWRADGAPSHVTTLLPDHPIAAGIPATFDLPHTEMYSEPFEVPEPDAVIFQEKWDKGERFRSGCLWKVGKGQVFYFRPGHEIYPIYKDPTPLKILENAARYLAPNAK